MPSPETWTRFVDDASPLTSRPPVLRPSPAIGDRVVRDEDLPHLAGYAGDVRLVVSGGVGQLARPAAYCRSHGLELSSLDVALRDPGDPAGTARRLVAALDAAVADGDVPDDTIVHVRLTGPPTPAGLAAADVLAELTEVVPVLCLSLDAGEPDEPDEPAAWIDAALDRELPVSLIGGTVTDAVRALTTAARLWGDADDLDRARRWVRCWATDAPDAALEHLSGLGSRT